MTNKEEKKIKRYFALTKKGKLSNREAMILVDSLIHSGSSDAATLCGLHSMDVGVRMVVSGLRTINKCRSTNGEPPISQTDVLDIWRGAAA